MLVTSKCFERRCRHYRGVYQPDGTEETERHVCAAYPEIIPADIVEGKDPHTSVRDDQDNDVIFEVERRAK